MSRITQQGATAPIDVQSGGVWSTSTDASLATMVGTRWDLSDGGQVMLVQTAAATTTVAGKLYADPVLVGNNLDLVVTATQAYSNNGNTPATVTVTLGGTAVTANQYQGGYLIVEEGTGLGQTLRIAGHPAQATTTGNVVITLEDAPGVALDTTSKCSLIPAHGSNVIISPTTPTVPCGVALYAIAPSSYGFVKCKGLVGAVSDSSNATVANSIMPSTTTAGDVTLFIATGANIGSAGQTGVSAKATLVMLNI
jgi:hypothetical protein